MLRLKGMDAKAFEAVRGVSFQETDIMLIDEVLSVGDEKFKKKSYEKMKSLISQRNRTVVIVSHNLKTLEELCDRVMWMHEGELMKIGEPKEILKEYKEFMK